MAILLFYYKILYRNFTLLVSSYSLYKQLLSVENLFPNTKEFQNSVNYFIHHPVFNFKFKSLKRTLKET